MFRTVLFGLAAALVGLPANAAQIDSYILGNWTVGIHRDDATGVFSSCIATASFNSGINMAVLVDRNFAWNLGFASEAWRYQLGERISIQYRFDRSNWTGATAEAISETLVTVPMPSDGLVASMFRRGRTMEVSDGRLSLYFDLTGTSRLLVSLVECVQTRLRAEQTVASSAAPEPADRDVTALRLEGTRILSNFLLAANLVGAELIGLEQADDAMAFAHAIATADGLLAFVHVVPNPEAIPDYLAAEMAARISSGCSGKFGTGSTKEKVEGAVLINAFAACQIDSGSTYLQYVVTGRQPAGQYVIGLLSSGAAGSSGAAASPPVKTERLMNAAYKASQ